LYVYREIGGLEGARTYLLLVCKFNRSLRLKARKHGMTLNQRGKRTTVLDPTVGLIKELTVRGTGLYGGVVRDLKDPSKKAISGKRFNSIKQLFCAL